MGKKKDILSFIRVQITIISVGDVAWRYLLNIEWVWAQFSPYLKSMAILITGGLGYIGSHLAVTLAKKHDIYLLDILSKENDAILNLLNKLIPNKFVFLNVDLLNSDKVFSLIQTCKIDLIFHCAVVRNQEAMRSCDVNKNELLLQKLMLLVQKLNINNFVFASSAAVYGHAALAPISESKQLSPQSVYGKSKVLIEKVLLEHCNRNLDFCAVALRIFNVAGNEALHFNHSNLIQNVAKVVKGIHLILDINSTDHPTNDGTYIRDYIHITDVIGAFDKSINFTKTNKGFFTINIGTGIGTSVLDLVDAFERVSMKRINYRAHKDPSFDVSISIADNSLAKKLLGWEPKTDLSYIALNLLEHNIQ